MAKDPLGAFLEGFQTTYKATKERIAATAKAEAAEEEKARKARTAASKQRKTDAKVKYTTYQKRVTNLVKEAADDSPLKAWGNEVLASIDKGLMILENPNLSDPNFDQDAAIQGWEDDFNTMIETHGGLKIAGYSINPQILMKSRAAELQADEDEAYTQKFNSFDKDTQNNIVKNNANFTKIVEKGALDNHIAYIKAIREQYESEDKLPDAVKENLVALKRQLQEYYTRSVWEEYKNAPGSIIPAATKGMIVQGAGMRPIEPLDVKGEAIYNSLLAQYTNIHKQYTGMDVFYIPDPVEITEDPNNPGQFVATYGSNNPGVIEFNIEQLKDRNKIIENVASKRIVKDIEAFTGENFAELHTTVDYILDNPDEMDRYTPEFITSLKDINMLFDEIDIDLGFDFGTSKYGKVDFIAGTPDEPEAAVARFITEEEREKLEDAPTVHPYGAQIQQYRSPHTQ